MTGCNFSVVSEDRGGEVRDYLDEVNPAVECSDGEGGGSVVKARVVAVVGDCFVELHKEMIRFGSAETLTTNREVDDDSLSMLSEISSNGMDGSVDSERGVRSGVWSENNTPPPPAVRTNPNPHAVS